MQQAEYYKELFENAFEPILLMENDTIIDGNKAALKLYELNSKEDLQRIHPSQLSPKYQPDGMSSYEKSNKLIETCYQQGYNRFEWLCKSVNGNEWLAEITLKLVTINDKTFIHVSERLLDKEKEFEENIKNQEKLLKENSLLINEIKQFINTNDHKKIVNSLNLFEQYKRTLDETAIVSKADSKGIITYANNKFCEISGYKKEELIGKSHSLLRHEDMPQKLFNDLWNTIKNKKQTWHGKIKNKKKNGSFYWVKATIKPILDIDNNIIEFIAIREDITDEENYKQLLKGKLQESTQSLEGNLNYINQYENGIAESTAIAKTNKNLEIIYVNESYLHLTQYKEIEMLRQPMSKFVDESELIHLPKIMETISNGKSYTGIFQGKPKSGNPYYTKTTIKPIKNLNDEIIEYLFIKNDITAQIELSNEIEETQKEVVLTMGAIGETRSKETGLHVKRVAEYSYLLALLYGLDEKEAQIIKMASPMHDIGKVGIPDHILNKPGKLTDDEYKTMKEHASIGYEMLKSSNREILKASSIIAYEHHEKWDGTGYPRGLKADDIHIYGRITAIADVFDALGHTRIYKLAWELDKIFNFFKTQRGKHFDPTLIDLFFDNIDEFLTIRDKYENKQREVN